MMINLQRNALKKNCDSFESLSPLQCSHTKWMIFYDDGTKKKTKKSPIINPTYTEFREGWQLTMARVGEHCLIRVFITRQSWSSETVGSTIRK